MTRSGWGLVVPAFGAGAVAAGLGWAVSLRRANVRADRDGLTGLLRREGFERRAPAALSRCTVAGLLDVAGFKAVNDGFGHAVGDAVLRAVGSRLEQELGDDGLVGRIGGDEFALLARVAAPGVAAWLDQLVEALTAPVSVPGMCSVPVRVSLGVAWLADLPSRGSGSRGAMLAEGLAHADIAMYEARSLRRAWGLYDPATSPARPAAGMCAAPPRRFREHGPAALVDARRAAGEQH